ncbi:MAG: SulP family inorganic anion transporter [Cyclobacteriaceae bacterium]|jgi:MFS superfamily sulfate permease-like transporter|nr:SulP family inorganic anion transporter [Cyclobacteriaceae bacterium]
MDLRSYARHDLPAALVVFLVALPLCLGIALASGAPLFSGIVAGVIGGVVIGFLSGSSLSVSGPAAGLITIVSAGIATLQSYEAFLFALVLAGVFQVALGFAKGGNIGHFFPVSVIKGMLAAIGLTLILKQIPHALGRDTDFEGDESFEQPDGQNTFTEIAEAIQHPTVGAILVCLLTLAIIYGWERPALKRFAFFTRVPGALVAVLAGSVFNVLLTSVATRWAISDVSHFVSLPSTRTDSLSAFLVFPDFSVWRNPDVYVIALTLALVASLETLLSIEASDKLDPFKRHTPLNRELRAQGVGNVVSGLIGGLPLTSVIVRSSANIGAGARSKASAITHGFILLAAVIAIPHFLELIPKAALAAVLFSVGYKLTKPSLFMEMRQKGNSQLVPFIVTVVAILFTDLLIGVVIGILVALFYILRTNFQRAVVLVSTDHSYLVKFTRDVTFLNKASLRHIFNSIPNDSRVIIDGKQANFIDQDIQELLRDFSEAAINRNITVETTHINNLDWKLPRSL